MRLIEADELLQDVIGLEDGWLKPPKNCYSVIDLIKNAPTIKGDDTFHTLLEIYNFAYNTFFGTNREEVMFRINQGSNGAERKVLDYIENKMKNI